jgi:phosphoribosylformylglycinamidine synthase PurS subunit
LIARVVVTPKPVVNDPQGATVRQALGALGFEEVRDVRVGKYIEVSLDADSEKAAGERVEEMCRKLLANHVIEDFRYSLGPLPQNGEGESGRNSDGPGDPSLPSDASSSRTSDAEAGSSGEKRLVP